MGNQNNSSFRNDDDYSFSEMNFKQPKITNVVLKESQNTSL